MPNPGLDIIRQFEGCCLKAYPDPGTGGEPWTIGYGHTGGVHPGQVITQAQADGLLMGDYYKFQVGVLHLVKVHLSANQLGALISFSFNVGLANLASSTLLRVLNAGDYGEAARQFTRWTKAAGKELPGLVKRRDAEQRLFLQV